MRTGFTAALAVLVLAAPAFAYDGLGAAEASHLALMTLGLAGVIVGRRAAIHAQRRIRARERDPE